MTLRTIMVPSSLDNNLAASFKSPITAYALGLWLFCTKAMAASILGPILPGNFAPALVPNKYSGVTNFISFASGLPKFFHIPPPSVKIKYASASNSVANLEPQASLSITASTPCNVCGRDGTRDTGTPPPPHAMGNMFGQWSKRVRTASTCNISLGGGLGTTRRKYSPSAFTIHPNDSASACASLGPYTGPTNLVGFRNAGSCGSTTTWVIIGTALQPTLANACANTYPICPILSLPNTSNVAADRSKANSPTCGPLPCVSTIWCSWHNCAIVGAISAAAFNIFSIVNRSPRRCKALPPTAITMRSFCTRVVL